MIVTMARDTAPAQPPRARQCPPFECVALTLQGGGALGGYQAGVYQALDEAQVRPDWVAGISIGAINAAIIVRNRPEARRSTTRILDNGERRTDLGRFGRLFWTLVA